MSVLGDKIGANILAQTAKVMCCFFCKAIPITIEGKNDLVVAM